MCGKLSIFQACEVTRSRPTKTHAFSVCHTPRYFFTRSHARTLDSRIPAFFFYLTLSFQKIWISPVSIPNYFLAQLEWPEAGPVFAWGRRPMLRSNGHLNLKRGHSLDSTCSHLAPNLIAKNAGNLRSWELNFQIPRGAFPRTPVADLLFFGFFFYTERSLRAKKIVFSEYEICLKMLEMAF